MQRWAFITILIIIVTATSRGINIEEHLRVKGLVAERSYIVAIDELNRLKSSDQNRFELNNYDYLLARVAHRNDQFAIAVANYQAVANRQSALRGYALWHLAQIARTFGNPLLERQYLRELQFVEPTSLLKTVATNRIARSYHANGDFDLAKLEFERLLDGFGSSYKNIPDRLARENLSLLAECYSNIGDIDTARQIFSRLLNETAVKKEPDDFALTAVKELDRLDTVLATKQFSKLSAEQHQQRAWVYQFNREFENARQHYLTIVNEPTDEQFASDAAYQIGRGYSQINDFTEAAKWYERVLEQFPETVAARDALLAVAASYARLGKHRESSMRYRMFIDRFPNDERLDRAYLNMIDIARDQDEETEALRRASTAQEVFRGKPAEAQALFAEARIYIAHEEWHSAADALKRLEHLPDLGSRLPGGTNLAEVLFLRGYVFEQRQEWPQAIDVYLSITDGLAEFYGSLATDRLRVMAEKPETKLAIATRRDHLNDEINSSNLTTRRQALQAIIRLTTDQNERARLINELKNIYSQLSQYSLTESAEKHVFGRTEILKTDKMRPTDSHKAVDELAFLGLYDEAVTEIEARENIKDSEYLTEYFLSGDYADRAIKIAESKYKLPADFQIELIPPRIVAMLYPHPFDNELLLAARNRNIDPRFLLAIMRQESRFRPTVKSNAAARGLMQFISTTSNRIASELKLADFRQNDLYDPTIAILMGSQYLSGLFTLYPKQHAAVAASYNGGEDNMKRWMGRSNSDIPGRYVPEIMYAQTKDYVYKVMTSYRVYTSLYDENLQLPELRSNPGTLRP